MKRLIRVRVWGIKVPILVGMDHILWESKGVIVWGWVSSSISVSSEVAVFCILGFFNITGRFRGVASSSEGSGVVS